MSEFGPGGPNPEEMELSEKGEPIVEQDTPQHQETSLDTEKQERLELAEEMQQRADRVAFQGGEIAYRRLSSGERPSQKDRFVNIGYEPIIRATGSDVEYKWFEIANHPQPEEFLGAYDRFTEELKTAFEDHYGIKGTTPVPLAEWYRSGADMGVLSLHNIREYGRPEGRNSGENDPAWMDKIAKAKGLFPKEPRKTRYLGKSHHPVGSSSSLLVKDFSPEIALKLRVMLWEDHIPNPEANEIILQGLQQSLKGFAHQALESGDIQTAKAAYERLGMQDDPEIAEKLGQSPPR